MSRTAVNMGLLALLAVCACDNTIDPFVSTTGESFAIYGYLDSEADTQFVRVSPVIDESGFAYGDTLNAHAELVNLQAGSRFGMDASSAPLENGRRAYFFYTTAALVEGAEYRLDVFRPGGDTTHAFTRLPGTDQIDVLDPEINFAERVVQRIDWIDVGEVRDLQIHYHLRSQSSTITRSLTYRSPTFGGSNVTIVNLEIDRETILSQLPAGHDPEELTLLGVSATAELLSPEWAPGAAPDRIFFGSVGRVQKEWTLADSTIARIGYLVP